MKHLYFVRHGLSVMNKAGVFSGRTETPLTSEGHEQCAKAGVDLASADIDLIVSSPIRRAYDSARIIAEQLGINPDDIVVNELFVERDFGPLEGAPYTPTADLDGTDGVEHSTSVVARAKQGLAFLEDQKADTILVVSHGAVGRALEHLLNPNIPFTKTKKFENAEPRKLL